MIDTERKEDLFLDTKLIKSENRLGKLRIIDELHPVLGGQPTHEKDQPNDNNPFLDLACTMQFTIDKVNEVDKKADTKLAKAQNLKDVANVAIARDNLGLGTSATMNATSTLSDRTDQTATIKVVNDVNRDVVTAQKTANTANDKANAAQTTANQAKSAATTADSKATSAQNKADSAYNLAENKRSKTDFYFSDPLIVDTSRAENGDILLTSNKKFYLGYLEERGGTWIGNSGALIYFPKKSGKLSLISDLIGVNQKMIDMKSSRSAGSKYTNNTDKLIFVSVSFSKGNLGTDQYIYVDDVIAARTHRATGVDFQLFAPVPAGSTYKVEGSGEISLWTEFR